MASAQAQSGNNFFDEWLRRNNVRMIPSLLQKLRAHHFDDIDMLSQLKVMGGNTLEEIVATMQLNAAEKCMVYMIIAKLDVEGGAGPSPANANHDTQIMIVVPEIVSVADNKNGAVNVSWKLVAKPLANNGNRGLNGLELVWADDEKAMEHGHVGGKQLDRTGNLQLDTVYESKNVVVDNVNATVFRLKWQNLSNTKTAKIESDVWDENAKGQHITIDAAHRNVIKHTADNAWNSVYGKVVCKAPYTYHWRFRIKAFALHFMFGVAKLSNGIKWKDTYFGQGECGYYAAYPNINLANVYTTGTGQSIAQGQHGMQRFNKNGDVIDMYLDLKNYTLSFKTGGEDTGVCIQNLPREEYRMIVSLYNHQQIELLAFDYM